MYTDLKVPVVCTVQGKGDMTVVSLCMAANDTQMCPNLALKVVDEMHSLVMLFLTQLTQVVQSMKG